jgi:methionyl-tRNA synthetase
MTKYYITTSIPYINGEPHIGHAYEFVIGDVLARYARLSHDPVVYAIGTDEHGGKIAEKADELGVSPQELADKNSQLFKDLAKKLNLSNDRFVRTTDEKHIKASQEAWKRLSKEIYKGKYKGWYCTGEEAFFTETEVKANNGTCPNHNRPYELIEEENYFFPLSKYSSAIAKAIESNEFKVTPETRKNEILSLIHEGLEDISISRPKKTIPWGIAVPDDETQVMYVWFEAVLNYLSVIGYPDEDEFKTLWPADTQVIGKDIIRFHAAILPALLLGLDLPLAKNLYVHGFISIEGQKMGKSLGNFIHPDEIIDKYGVDPLRYYLLRHIPSYSDGDFSWDLLKASYDDELANELGNALSRTIALVVKYFDGHLGEIKPESADVSEYELHISEYRLDKALEFIWLKIRELNQYIDENKPWSVAKEGNQDKLKEILSAQVSKLLLISDLLGPFLPETAEKIQSALNTDKIETMSSNLFPKDEHSV